MAKEYEYPSLNIPQEQDVTVLKGLTNTSHIGPGISGYYITAPLWHSRHPAEPGQITTVENGDIEKRVVNIFR